MADYSDPFCLVKNHIDDWYFIPIRQRKEFYRLNEQRDLHELNQVFRSFYVGKPQDIKFLSSDIEL